MNRQITLVIGLPESGKSTIGRAMAIGNDLRFADCSTVIKEHLAQILAGVYTTVGSRYTSAILAKAGVGAENMDPNERTEVAIRQGFLAADFWNSLLDSCIKAATASINGALAIERAGNRAEQPMRDIMVLLGDMLCINHGADYLSRTLYDRGISVIAGVRRHQELAEIRQRIINNGDEVRIVWIERPMHPKKVSDNTTVVKELADVVITAIESGDNSLPLSILPDELVSDPKARCAAVYNAIWNGSDYHDHILSIKHQSVIQKAA